MRTTLFNCSKALIALGVVGYAGVMAQSDALAQTADPGKNYVTNLQLGTANPGGGYYTMGSEYANIFEKRIDMPDLHVSAVQTSGSVDNLAKITREDIQLGLAQATTAEVFFSGEGKYKNVDTSAIGLLGCLEPYALHVFTLAGTGIESIKDLKGKRVAIGAPGSANQLASKQLLNAYGFDDGDYQAYPEASDDARQKLRDSNLDAIIDVQPVPFPGLQELESAKGGVRILSLDAPELKSFLDNSDFAPYTISADSYEFNKTPIDTVSDWSCLFASKTQVSPELGYALTQAVYEYADDLTSPSKKSISADTAIPSGSTLPLHPGAQQYFKEKNIIE